MTNYRQAYKKPPCHVNGRDGKKILLTLKIPYSVFQNLVFDLYGKPYRAIIIVLPFTM